MFAGALNICSSKEYIYVMDDALSIYIYIFFNDGCFFVIQIICLQVPWIYMFTGAFNIFFEEYIYAMDVISMLQMIYIYPRKVF